MSKSNYFEFNKYLEAYKGVYVFSKIPNQKVTVSTSEYSGWNHNGNVSLFGFITNSSSYEMYYFNKDNQVLGILTGYYWQYGSVYYLEVSDGQGGYGIIRYDYNNNNREWLLLTNSGGGTNNNEPPQTTNNVTLIEGQNVVNKLMANNAVIWQNLLFCARFSDKLTVAQQKRLVECYRNLDESNTKILNDGSFNNKQVSYPKEFIQYNSNLQALVTNPALQGIGAGILTTIVVVAIALTVLSLVAYAVYKDYLKRSELDVKWSTETANLLKSKLTESEYAQVENELGQKVWAGYQAGLKDGKFKQLATFGIIGILALLFLLNPTGRNE